MSANAFDVLGVTPAAGRLLNEGDDRPDAPLVVVLSYRLWQRRFGGSADAVGKTARINGRVVRDRRRAAGAVSAAASDIDVVTPLAPDRDPLRHVRSSVNFLRLFGRLNPGTGCDSGTSGADRDLSFAQAAVSRRVRAKGRRECRGAARGPGRRLSPIDAPAARRGDRGAGHGARQSRVARRSFARTDAGPSCRCEWRSVRRGCTSRGSSPWKRWCWQSTGSRAGTGCLRARRSPWRCCGRRRRCLVWAKSASTARWRSFAVGVTALVTALLTVAPLGALARTRAGDVLRASRGAIGDRSNHRVRHALVVSEIAAALVLLLATIVLVQNLRRLQRSASRVRSRMASSRRACRFRRRIDRRTTSRVSTSGCRIDSRRRRAWTGLGVISVAPLSGLLATVPFSVAGSIIG